MPELPEVETVRRGLAPFMEGRVLQAVTLNRPNLRFPFAPDFVERLQGHRIMGLTRRAKFLLAEIESGDNLVMHLGMSGRFTVDADYQPGQFTHTHPTNPKHDHVEFVLSGRDLPDTRITFNDPRRFGFMELYTKDAPTRYDALGPEPLSNQFSPASLSDALSGKNTPIKSALLDQRVVAGLGNIYVCEALHMCRIAPTRKARDISETDAATLVPAIKDTLNRAIAAGGSTLRDFAGANGDLGYFQHSFNVYGREGEPCPSEGCDTPIARIKQAGRSTFYCPTCQAI